MKRISHYQGTYEPLSEEHDKNLSFIKIFDQGDKFLVNKVLGRYFYGITSEILNVIWRMHMMQASVWWVFQPCHNTFMLVLIGILLNSFNSHLRKRLLSISCCNDTLYEDLELFRRARLELCALVDALDKLISVNMGISIATSTVIIVIVTYLVSVGLTPEDGNIRYMVLFWCVVYFVILFSVIAMCHVIKTKVRRIFC